MSFKYLIVLINIIEYIRALLFTMQKLFFEFMDLTYLFVQTTAKNYKLYNIYIDNRRYFCLNKSALFTLLAQKVHNVSTCMNNVGRSALKMLLSL